MKYNEDKIIKEISDYIKSTYTEHYSTTKDGFQVQDMLRHLGIDKDFYQQMQSNILLDSVRRTVKQKRFIKSNSLYHIINE